MPDSRIAVTGVGIISALGHGLSQTWKRIQEGQSGIKLVTAYDTQGLYCPFGAEVSDTDMPHEYTKREQMLYDRTSQLGFIAAKDAIKHARLDIDPSRTGIVVGVGVPGRQTADAVLEQYYLNNKRIPPMTIFRGMPNAVAAHIAIQHGITGPSNTVSTACSSGNQAIINAIHMLKMGDADVVVTGAADSPFTRPFHESWEALRILSRGKYAPFSSERDGIILGEGAAFLVLETKDNADRRGADIHAFIDGYGSSTDALDIAAPSAAGMAQAMRQALSRARVEAGQVSAVCAHGTGTPSNDVCECEAINNIFESNKNVPVYATKPFHGHALGASPIMETIISILAMKYSLVPPTINCLNLAPECDINLITEPNTEVPLKHVINNSFAFGGNNTAVLITNSTV